MTSEALAVSPHREVAERSDAAPPRRWTLIFDGDCGFCRRQVRWIQQHDTQGLIAHVPFQGAQLDSYGVSRAAAEEAMHLVAPSGTVWRGASAARELLRLLPRYRYLAWIFHIPGAMWVAERVYRWVARRRHRFGCESPACRRGASGS